MIINKYVASLAAIVMLLAGNANAVRYDFTGDLFDTGNTGAIPGPIEGWIEFAGPTFTPGETLNNGDITDFSFTAEINALDVTWSFADASYFAAEFVVDGTGTNFATWGFFAEDELVSGNSNVETVIIDNLSSLVGLQRQAVTTGDDHPNLPTNHTSELGAQVFQTGSFVREAGPVPVPGTLTLLGLGLVALGVKMRASQSKANSR